MLGHLQLWDVIKQEHILQRTAPETWTPFKAPKISPSATFKAPLSYKPLQQTWDISSLKRSHAKKHQIYNDVLLMCLPIKYSLIPLCEDCTAWVQYFTVLNVHHIVALPSVKLDRCVVLALLLLLEQDLHLVWNFRKCCRLRITC